MEHAKKHVLKGLVILGFILSLLFPVFLPNNLTAGTEPKNTEAAAVAVQHTPATVEANSFAQPVNINAASAAGENTETDFPTGKLVIFAGLLVIVVIAFFKWGMVSAKKEAGQKNNE